MGVCLFSSKHQVRTNNIFQTSGQKLPLPALVMGQSVLELTCASVRLAGHQTHERWHHPPSCTLWPRSCVRKEIHGDGILWERLMAWAMSALWKIKSTDLHLANTWKDKQCLVWSCWFQWLKLSSFYVSLSSFYVSIGLTLIHTARILSDQAQSK